MLLIVGSIKVISQVIVKKLIKQSTKYAERIPKFKNMEYQIIVSPLC